MTDATPGPPPRPKPRQPPPPLTRSVQGPLLPHAAVLDELASPVGVLLWGLLRDATLWGTAEASAREGLFADAARATAGLVPEVEEELDALGVLVRDPHPDAAPLVARMCDRVRAWAEGRGLYGTALAFAQAAALADPADARCAYEVGRLARGRAEYARADVWYQRAVVLARRSGDAEAWALGLSGLANMHAQRGNYALARRLKLGAARLARRNSLSEVLGGVYHDLAVLDFESGNVQSGMSNARRALRVLGRDHDYVPVVVQDIAAALMDQCGAFASAREVLGAVLPHVHQRGARLMAIANLARAAGGSGAPRLFEAAWTEAWTVLTQTSEATGADALLALGRGAGSLGQWERANEAASRALAIARTRREGKAICQAETLLDSLRVEERTAPTKRQKSFASEDPAVAAFADDLVESLRTRMPFPDALQDALRAVLDAPEDVRRAFDLGRALRTAAEYDRGAAWFEYGARLARDSGDLEAEAMCIGGLGNLFRQRGDLPRALEMHQRHLELAQRNGLRKMEGFALVDLCAVCFALDQGESGFAYAREALALLEPGDPLWPRLAHDLAMYLMERRGDFGNALAVFHALQGYQLPEDFSLIVRASLARAAAGAGRVQLFEDTWGSLWTDIQNIPDVDCPSGALIQMAQGALIRGHSDLAESAARRALRIGRDRGEAQTATDAERWVEAAESARRTQQRTSAPRDPTHDERAASRLTRGFVTALRSGVARHDRATHSPGVAQFES